MPAGSNITPSWEQLHSLAKEIVQKMDKDGFAPTRIVGVAKGGIIPAALIYQAFPDAEFITIRTKHYGPEGRLDKVELFDRVNYLCDLNLGDTLVVDDICDSGGTFRELQKWMPDAKYAALLWRLNNEEFPLDYHGTSIGAGWVDFPWEGPAVEVQLPF